MDEVALFGEEILVRFDVKYLFTSIPVDEAISIGEERLKGDDTLEKRTQMKVGTIVKLLQVCLHIKKKSKTKEACGRES